MRATEQGNTARWSVVASLALHAFVVGPVLLFRTVPVKPPPEQRVDVQILTPREYEAATGSGEAAKTPLQVALPPASTPAVPPKPLAMAVPAKPESPREMIRPTSMLSEKSLADPRSREARAALSTFAESERVEQLCGIEAMAQIHAWRATF